MSSFHSSSAGRSHWWAFRSLSESSSQEQTLYKPSFQLPIVDDALLVPKLLDSSGGARAGKQKRKLPVLRLANSCSAAARLSQFRSASNIFLLAVCTRVVWLMVKAISKRFDKHSDSLHQMDYNDSYFFLRHIFAQTGCLQYVAVQFDNEVEELL